MAKNIKAACVAGALTMGLLGATTAAKASEIVGIPHGSAPSPEMNTLLGLLVVAGTVVFIKRRRGNKVEAEDAAA